jgi:hypothetical protein
MQFEQKIFSLDIKILLGSSVNYTGYYKNSVFTTADALIGQSRSLLLLDTVK